MEASNNNRKYDKENENFDNDYDEHIALSKQKTKLIYLSLEETIGKSSKSIKAELDHFHEILFTKLQNGNYEELYSLRLQFVK
jgi:hypothetical protein